MKAVLLVLLIAFAGCLGGGVPSVFGGTNVQFHEALVWPEPANLVVQISYSPDHLPSAYALQKLEDTLQMETAKESIVLLAPQQIQAGNGRADQVWTIPELRQLHANHYVLAHPDYYVEDGTMYLHFLFLNGYGRQESGDFVGVAIRPDLYVFADTSDTMIAHIKLEENVGPPHIAPEQVEAAITVHELGHALGLVGRGAPETADRKTTEAQDPCMCHSQHEDSVMFPGVEGINIERFLESRDWVRQGFDATDKADLAALRALY